VATSHLSRFILHITNIILCRHKLSGSLLLLMSEAKYPFLPQKFKEVVMPFSQSVYMTVVVLNGDTVRARGRGGCCGGGRINFLTDVPKTISSLRDIQGLQMDVPTDRLCGCVSGGGGGGGETPPPKKPIISFF
jgi:hypothetical protein